MVHGGVEYGLRGASISITAEQFKLIPRYSTTSHPDYFAPTNRSEIDKQYGVLRRLERRFNR